MGEILPAILVQDEQTFHERLASLQNAAHTIHLDLIDHSFVPFWSWCDFSVLAQLPPTINIELHLMVDHPMRYIIMAENLPQFSRFIWHIESRAAHAPLIQRIHTKGKEAGIALSPKTSPDVLKKFVSQLDEILVMGNRPGQSGLGLDPHMVDRAHTIHTMWPTTTLGFDIGVNKQTIPQLKAAGVTRFCAGGAIFSTPNPAQAYREMQKMVERK